MYKKQKLHLPKKESRILQFFYAEYGLCDDGNCSGFCGFRHLLCRRV